MNQTDRIKNCINQTNKYIDQLHQYSDRDYTQQDLVEISTLCNLLQTSINTLRGLLNTDGDIKDTNDTNFSKHHSHCVVHEDKTYLFQILEEDLDGLRTINHTITGKDLLKMGYSSILEYGGDIQMDYIDDSGRPLSLTIRYSLDNGNHWEYVCTDFGVW